jgi:hypothetical protein
MLRVSGMGGAHAPRQAEGAADTADNAKRYSQKTGLRPQKPSVLGESGGCNLAVIAAVPGRYLAVLGALQIKYRFAAEDFRGPVRAAIEAPYHAIAAILGPFTNGLPSQHPQSCRERH